MDWKFIVSTLLALIAIATSVLVPLWQVNDDIQSRAITMKVIASLGPSKTLKSAFPEVKIELDGKPLDSPTITFLAIESSGKRPVVRSDFDGPLEIRLRSRSYILRARVIQTEPPEVKAVLTFDSTVVKLEALLLNPTNRVVVAVLTVGERPEFRAISSVAGVTSVVHEDDTNPKPSYLRGRIYIAISVASLALTVLFMAMSIAPCSLFPIPRVLAIATYMACTVASALALTRAFEHLNLESTDGNRSPHAVAGVLLGVLTIYLVAVWRRRRARINKPSPLGLA